MRKFLTLVVLAVVLAGGAVAIVAAEKPTPALACDGNGC